MCIANFIDNIGGLAAEKLHGYSCNRNRCVKRNG